MSSVAPCLEYCSDEKSSQTSLLMELSPLSNNTQPSPKDSGVDVSSPSRRDEDTIFGSPQITQVTPSSKSVFPNNSNNKCNGGMFETSDMLAAVGLGNNVKIMTSTGLALCSPEISTKKLDGKEYSKTSKFYSRDRKKHFNIGEFQAKEFRKIIMSDPKDKKRKCPSFVKSSSLVGKCTNGHSFGLGSAARRASDDFNKNYAVVPIEEKKVGVVIRVTKPFTDSKKRKVSSDKLEMPPKKPSKSPDNSLEINRVDVTDRSSNMSPTMPELHKETPFVGGKFMDDNKRTTRLQINNLPKGIECIQSDRRSNLRSSSKTSSNCKHQEDALCPFPPVITAIESQGESSVANPLPKKITCKLAGNVIVKTLMTDQCIQSKSCPRIKRSKSRKSSKETKEYLQVKSISGLKIKLAKPKAFTPSVHGETSKLLDDFTYKDDHPNVAPAQDSGSNFSSMDSESLCKIVSSCSVSSPIMSSQFCSPVSRHCSKLICLESDCSIMARTETSMSNDPQAFSGPDDFHLEKLDGKVKFTQEKEVVMPDGKKKKLKLKMFVPSPVILSSSCQGEFSDLKMLEKLSKLYGQSADNIATTCQKPVKDLHLSSCESSSGHSFCGPPLSCNSFSVPGISAEGGSVSSHATCSVAVCRWPLPQGLSRYCTQDVAHESVSSDFDLENTAKLSVSSVFYKNPFIENFSCANAMQKNCKSNSHLFGSCDSQLLNHEKTASQYKVVACFHDDTLNRSSPHGVSKCNSAYICKPPAASNVSRVIEALETTGTLKESSSSFLNSHCAMTSLNNALHSENVFGSVCISPTTKCLKESCNSLEGLSRSFTSVKGSVEELDDYGDMPTLEKNDISGQTYPTDHFNDEKSVDSIVQLEIDTMNLLLENSKSAIDKENLQERAPKKTFKFDGLELEYSVENLSNEGSFATSRCLRRRGKDEKEEKEKLEKQKPKRKRGVSRTNMKKMKASDLSYCLEAASQENCINQKSHIEEPASSRQSTVFLSDADNKSASKAFSSSVLNQTFDFSTPPPSDASCPLGEFSGSSLEDSRFTCSVSSLVCSKSFCINQPAFSGSIAPFSSSSLLVASSSSTISISSSAALSIASSPPLPGSQALFTSQKSFVTSENLNSLHFSPYKQTRNLDLPVISSHLSPLSSVCMTPASAEIHLAGPRSSVVPVLDSPDYVMTSLSPSPPPPPPKFVRSFKEVEPSSLESASTMVQAVTSSIVSASFCTDMGPKNLLSTSLDVPLNLFLGPSSNSHGPVTTLFGSTNTSGNCSFIPSAIAMCNGRDKSALFEEKSMRLHRISQRLQANSAISLKNSSNAQNADGHVVQAVLEGPAHFMSQMQEKSKVDKEEVEVEEKGESKEKILDENLREYYRDNEEEITKYITDQMQLVKLRNKAYRLFCCLFPEVQMPLRLSPDSEAVDQLLESVVLMLEEKSKVINKEGINDIVASSEDAQEGSDFFHSEIKCKLHPRVMLCCKPQSCLLQLQGLVRQFLCLMLPNLNAYLNSDASLPVMDKIVDRVVLANCAFIGLGCTNGSSPGIHSAGASQIISNHSEDFEELVDT